MFIGMSTKVGFNPDLVPPISEGAHELIEACGFHLVNQEMMHLVYAGSTEEGPDTKRLTFSCLGKIQYDEYREGRWTTPFFCQIRFDIEEIRMVEILHHSGVINYFSIPEMRKQVSEALKAIRDSNIKPLTSTQLSRALVA